MDNPRRQEDFERPVEEALRQRVAVEDGRHPHGDRLGGVLPHQDLAEPGIAAPALGHPQVRFQIEKRFSGLERFAEKTHAEVGFPFPASIHHRTASCGIVEQSGLHSADQMKFAVDVEPGLQPRADVHATADIRRAEAVVGGIEVRGLGAHLELWREIPAPAGVLGEHAGDAVHVALGVAQPLDLKA